MTRRPREIDWLEVLDFRSALTTLHYELQGDWYRDPWGWPELDWVVSGNKTGTLVERLNSHGVRRAAKIDVPKENFGTRPAIIIDPVDRLIYQALVDRMSTKLIGRLRPWVYGWRLVPGDPAAGEWSHNDLQHKRFRGHLSLAADLYDVALRTDIVSFFASIEVDRLCEMIESRCRSGKITDRLTGLVQGWNEIAGRQGLAQRSSASAALANMYLESVDDVLVPYQGRRRRSKRSLLTVLMSIPRVARWMDDIWVFGSDASRLRRAQLDLEEALRAIGLELNHSKTELLEGERVAEAAKKVEHSAVDRALNRDEPDVQPLEELIEDLLADPARADRTSIKFATHRMREHEIFDAVPDFADKANQMPHAADALARLFRDSAHWREMNDWFVDYATSDWGVLRWSVAQFATMFPSKVHRGKRALRPIGDFFMEVLQDTAPLPLVAVAAQRLAAWNGDDARLALREAATASENPHHRRVLALAAVGAGEERAVVRKMLQEFEENVVTRDMLNARGFRVKVKADFEGS